MDDQGLGVRIVQSALESPLRRLPAMQVKASVVVDKVRNGGDAAYGYNAATDTYEDLIVAGVIDPTKVCRCALQFAASVAGMLLTTQAIIADKPKADEPMPAPSAGMGGMGGMDF